MAGAVARAGVVEAALTAPIGIYVRVSRKGDREDDRFHSPREQAERASALAVARGFVPGPVFEDIDVSGATPPAERPAMGALLAAVERGELAGIAAYSLDRLSREPAHGDALVKRVTKAGGIILTPDIPDAIDSPTGEFTFGMLLQVAKLYRSQAGARFASAKERAIKKGIPVGPVGLGMRQKKDRTLEQDPRTARVVRELFERRARGGEGAGYTALANFLEKKTGRPWSRQAVASILANPIYRTGRLEYGGVVSDVSFEPIVDAPLWFAAQSSAPRRPPRSVFWLLTGLAKCAACLHALAPWTGARRRRRDPTRGRMDWVDVPNPPRRYRCVNRACVERASVGAQRLEAWVVRQTFAAGDELSTRSEATDLGDIEAALATSERRLDQVLAPDARDALGDLWAADVKERRAERDALLTELGQARQLVGPAAELRLREVWEDLSPGDRREALALFWKEIRVGRRREEGGTPVTFVARGPHGEAEVELPAG